MKNKLLDQIRREVHIPFIKYWLNNLKQTICEREEKERSETYLLRRTFNKQRNKEEEAKK